MDGGDHGAGRALPWSPVALTALGAIVVQQLLVLGSLRLVLRPELVINSYLTASGMLPYREIVDPSFPGPMFLPVNFHTLGVRSAWDFHLLLMAVVASQTVLTYVVARRLAGEAAGLLAALAYAAWQPFFAGDTLWLDSFLPLFTLPALLLLLDARWFLAGLALGAGVLFKQTLLPLVALAGLLVLRAGGPRGWRALLAFAAGALLPWSLVVLHLHAIGVLADFWLWAVRSHLTMALRGATLVPGLGDAVRIALPIAIVAAAVLRVPPHQRPGLVALWGCATVVGGLGHFGLIHLQPIVPCFAILTGMLGVELWRRRSTLALLALLMLSTVWLGEFYGRRSRWLDDPAQNDRLEEIAAVIRDRKGPSDRVLLLGLPSQLYATTGTLPPGRVYVSDLPWLVDVAGDRVVDALRRDPPHLVLVDPASGVDGGLLQEHAGALLGEVRRSYVQTARLGSIEVYERAGR